MKRSKKDDVILLSVEAAISSTCFVPEASELSLGGRIGNHRWWIVAVLFFATTRLQVL